MSMRILRRTRIVELGQIYSRQWFICSDWCSVHGPGLGKDNESSFLVQHQQPGGHDWMNMYHVIQLTGNSTSRRTQQGSAAPLLWWSNTPILFFPFSSSPDKNFSISEQSYYHTINDRKQYSLKFASLMVVFHSAGLREASLLRIMVGDHRKMTEQWEVFWALLINKRLRILNPASCELRGLKYVLGNHKLKFKL